MGGFKRVRRKSAKKGGPVGSPSEPSATAQSVTAQRIFYDAFLKAGKPYTHTFTGLRLIRTYGRPEKHWKEAYDE